MGNEATRGEVSLGGLTGMYDEQNLNENRSPGPFKAMNAFVSSIWTSLML